MVRHMMSFGRGGIFRMVSLLSSLMLALVATVLLGSAPAMAQGGCTFRTSFGGTTPAVDNGEGFGPVILDSGIFYNGTDVDKIEWETLTNQAVVDTANYNGKVTIVTININGRQQKTSSVDSGRETGPTQSIHGTIGRIWVDSSGESHTLVVGDLVTWSINVTYTKDNVPGQSGNTGAACTV